ncbi:RAMP superfamily [Sulfidibacter corallicola]|uniref:CRISPR type III-associated protein domain-containing protein n=1 Tax=Sulfidibacter corallicola TaxID=2818388 RepID=A0A8A4TVH8_SULCO|nr:RAMP superfamily CRISPR-associated protein [Sulfidibacter corallicola]QTD50535.1 hypothetical protein J3U87_33545 [Sulfidibacter corallicola]
MDKHRSRDITDPPTDRLACHFLYLARLVLQTEAPLSIGQGDPGPFDNDLVRDANGLPAIPGSSFAGVLRHAFRRRLASSGLAPVDTEITEGEQAQVPVSDTEDATTFLFGGTGEQELHSRVAVSWGCIHDSHDRPVEGLLLSDDRRRLFEDPLLRDALQAAPILRDHVAIDHRGVAANSAKFQRASLTKGHRFSIEISMWSDRSEDPHWRALLHLLESPGFRLGGATRRGLGALKVVRRHQRMFDMTSPRDFDDFAALSPSLADTTGLVSVDADSAEAAHASHEEVMASQTDGIGVELELTPVDTFLFGGGSAAINPNWDNDAKMKPIRETMVSWHEGSGSIGETYCLIPASSVKGALRHRTAYHYHALRGIYADCASDPLTTYASDPREALGLARADSPKAVPAAYQTRHNPAVFALFGSAPLENREAVATSDESDPEPDGWTRPGLVLIEDKHLSKDRVTPLLLRHNSIDRFTGGVRRHVLFGEEVATLSPPGSEGPARQGSKKKGPVRAVEPIRLAMRVLQPDDPALRPREVRQAFNRALVDLAEERLALGAGGNRGHGYFRGRVIWEDGGTWVNGEPQGGHHES